MYDLFHQWGSDLAVSSSGDLATSGGSDTVSQRVYRRLLTNPGDYIWNLDYGGGLAQFVGTPASSADIEAVIRTQLTLETAVATSPDPQVSVAVADVAGGYIVANILYSDAGSSAVVQLKVAADDAA